MSAPRNQAPDIFAFSNLQAFFAAVAAEKKAARPTWTYGIWARHLGLDNVGSLTRILSGERQLGDKLMGPFIQYFGFDELEAQYFRTLALLGRANGDALLEDALRGKMRELTIARLRSRATEPGALVAPGGPLLKFGQGRLLSIWGACPLATMDALLESDGMQAVPRKGAAFIGITICEYSETTLGPYSECYVTVLATPRGAAIDKAGLYFKYLFNSSPRASTYWRLVWGTPYELGQIELAPAAEVTHGRVRSASQLVVELSMNGVGEPLTENNLLLGIAGNGGEAKSYYRMALDMGGETRPFDATRDTFNVPSPSPLAKPLADFGFTPGWWVNYKRITGCIYAPEPLGAIPS